MLKKTFQNIPNLEDAYYVFFFTVVELLLKWLGVESWVRPEMCEECGYLSNLRLPTSIFVFIIVLTVYDLLYTISFKYIGFESGITKAHYGKSGTQRFSGLFTDFGLGFIHSTPLFSFSLSIDQFSTAEFSVFH